MKEGHSSPFNIAVKIDNCQSITCELSKMHICGCLNVKIMIANNTRLFFSSILFLCSNSLY